ncbi:MAG TPA: VOC family protein [Bryobacteraceae bacterium]
MITQLNAYLNFNGRCREAMTFYQQCLGGELTMQKIAETPFAVQMPSEAGINILHSSLTKDGVLLMMGSDVIGENLQQGNSVVLCLKCSTDEEMYKFFANLSAGGEVKMPLHQSFWGATYGELTDKFGMLWKFIRSNNQG